MNRAVKLLTVIDILFVLLLSVSGSIGGILSDAVYLLAFAVPVFIGHIASLRLREEREQVAGVRETPRIGTGITSEGVRLLFPMIAPTVAIIFVAALLTSLLLNAAGAEGSTVADAPLWQMLLVNALVPAVLEELTFRYIPLKLLLPYSPRWCVLISALYFAFIHCDLYQMPYAFIAGVIFALIDIVCDSILPSLILHFINNAASILWIKYATDTTAVIIYLSIMGALVAVSLVFIIINRRKYRESLIPALERGEGNVGRSPIMLALLTVGVAIINLLM